MSVSYCSYFPVGLFHHLQPPVIQRCSTFQGSQPSSQYLVDKVSLDHLEFIMFEVHNVNNSPSH